jgi:uncharacterized damage-inducible protein DinB
MSLQKLIRNYADYNLWANKTLVAWLKVKPAEISDATVASGFPTIAKTIAHVRSTEIFWYTLLLETPLQPVFSEGFNGNNMELMIAFVDQSEQFRDYVRSLSETQLEEPTILDQPWMKGRQPRYELIQHCINHSTYHRGQIITMARMLGESDPPMTDYNYYNMVVIAK